MLVNYADQSRDRHPSPFSSVTSAASGCKLPTQLQGRRVDPLCVIVKGNAAKQFAIGQYVEIGILGLGKDHRERGAIGYGSGHPRSHNVNFRAGFSHRVSAEFSKLPPDIACRSSDDVGENATPVTRMHGGSVAESVPLVISRKGARRLFGADAWPNFEDHSIHGQQCSHRRGESGGKIGNRCESQGGRGKAGLGLAAIRRWSHASLISPANIA